MLLTFAWTELKIGATARIWGLFVVRLALMRFFRCLSVFLALAWGVSVMGALPRVDPIDLRGVCFDAQQPVRAADLDPPSQELAEALDALKRNPTLQVFVSGYADTGEGSASEGQKISERRARLVYEWLLANGVASEQLAGHKGFGTERPVDFTDTEAQRRHNRCVELSVR